MSYRTFGQAGRRKVRENWSGFPKIRRLQKSKETPQLFDTKAGDLQEKV